MPRATSYELTERQQRVVELIAEGLTVPEIAAAMTISPSTVEGHVRAVKYKLGCRHVRQIPAAYFRATGRFPYQNHAWFGTLAGGAASGDAKDGAGGGQ